MISSYWHIRHSACPLTRLRGPSGLFNGDIILEEKAVAIMTRMEEILKGLEKGREEKPDLVETIDLHRALLLAQAGAQVSQPHLELETEEVTTFLQEGSPLLRPEELEIDWEVFAQLCEKICSIASQHRPELGEELEKIRAFLSNHPDKRSPVVHYLRDESPEGVEKTGLNGELLAFVLNNALHPFLRAHAEVLVPLIDDRLWYRGRCPVCGGQPDFALLEAETGGRHLLCSRCDSQWLFRRLGCPFCSNTEPNKLIYYPSEDEVYRLYVCQVCRRYLKTIDMRRATSKVIPPVERIITVAMDVAAREAGYT